MKRTAGRYKIILSLAFAILFSGCATAPLPRVPSEHLLTTDRPVHMVFRDLRETLQKNKYKVKREDTSAGIFVLHPRAFSFESGGQKIRGRHLVEMRQEGGSVKVRIIYTCNYSGRKGQYEACRRDDPGVQAKIARLEPALLHVIRPLLLKGEGDDSIGKRSVEITSDPQPKASEQSGSSDGGASQGTEEINESEWGL